MFSPVLIENREEYQYCLDRGYEPLIHSSFPMTIALRVEIQKEVFGHTVFGRGKVPAANQRFYKYVWKNKEQVCEECGRPLYFYSATYISHILSRGAYPEIAHDPRNANILCKADHDKWEDATTRKTMRIYPANIQLIDELKSEYNSIK